MSDNSRLSRRLRRSRLTEKRKSPEVDGDGSDEEEEDNDTCCVCGGPVPPALRHKTSSGNPTIQWAKCDSCQSWVHLQYCSKVRKVSPDDEFICPSCQPSTKGKREKDKADSDSTVPAKSTDKADSGASRSRKEVDYSQFGAADEDFDDDFADMTPPPGKRQKVSKEPKVKKEKKKERNRKNKTDPSKAPSRKSVGEKVYERELKIAMALSRQDAPLSPKANGNGVDPEDDTDDVVPSEDKAESDTDSEAGEMPVLKPVKPITPKKSPAKSRPSEDPDPDEIEVLEEDVQDVPSGGRQKRKAATKAITKLVKKEDDEEESKDLNPEDVSDDGSEDGEEEEEEDEEDGESDFEAHWNKKKKKRKGKSKTLRVVHAPSPSKPRPKPRLSAMVTPVNKGRGKPVLKAAIRTPSDHHHSPGLPSGRSTPSGPLVIRKPTWIPSGGVSVKSPGNLRLGLSKKSRVKPLHASVKVPQ